MSTKPHVGIVGAGLSGLRCADILLQNGAQVTILEARDRIGGRVGFPPAVCNVFAYLMTSDGGKSWIVDRGALLSTFASLGRFIRRRLEVIWWICMASHSLAVFWDWILPCDCLVPTRS